MVTIRVDTAQVRGLDGEVRKDLVGQTVRVVLRDTTTPYPITDGAGDPIPGSDVVVLGTYELARFYYETETPADLYLDWLDVASGARGNIDSDRALRDAARAAQAAAEQALSDLQGYIIANPPGSGGGTTDHGALSGRGDDDHPQYLTEGRGDGRYYTKEQAAQLIANAVSAAAPGNRDRGNHTGFQSISTITNLESRLAALEAGGGGGSGILVLGESDPIPVGTSAGTVILRIADDAIPPTTKFGKIDYASEGTTVTIAVPDGVEVGDAVVFVPFFDPVTGSSDITVSDTGWAELLDYSAQHSRDVAAYVYRVEDATALANLGATVTASYGVNARRAGTIVAIPGSLVDEAWPAYSSGSNRSAATHNSASTTGSTVQGFSTVTVPFHQVLLAYTCDALDAPAASDGFTVLGHASASSGGAEGRTLTLMIKALDAAPVPAAVVTHATAASTGHGGGQFIVPVAS